MAKAFRAAIGAAPRLPACSGMQLSCLESRKRGAAIGRGAIVDLLPGEAIVRTDIALIIETV
jgi:hypothetical protein